MIVQQKNNEILIRFQGGTKTDRIQSILDYLRYEELTSQSLVTEEELCNAKECIKGQMALRFEDSSALAMWYGRQSVLTGQLISPIVRVKQLSQVTADDIKKVANLVLQSKYINLASIGPDRSINHLLALLKL